MQRNFLYIWIAIVFLVVSNVLCALVPPDLRGIWLRNDGSEYLVDETGATIQTVGTALAQGKFTTGTLQIKDISWSVGEGLFTAVRRMNDASGNLSSWKNIYIKRDGSNLEVLNENQASLFTLTRKSVQSTTQNLSQTPSQPQGNVTAQRQVVQQTQQPASAPPKQTITQPATTNELNGLWCYTADGSIYRFNNVTATLEYLGPDMLKGNFQLGQAKISEITPSGIHKYAAKSRINNSEGSLLRWQDVTITLENGNLVITNLATSAKSYFNKTDEATLTLAKSKPLAPVQTQIIAAPKPSQTVLPPEEFTKFAKCKVPNPEAIAVIIGIKDYTNPDIPKVDYALRDAAAMKKYAIDGLGIREGNIIYLENPTQAQFYSIFGSDSNYKGKLYNWVKPGISDVFIYYSGHGAPDPESKNGYFVPVDCDPSMVALNGYSLSTFYKNLAQVPARSMNITIDACFSGASDKGMLIKNVSPVFIKTTDVIPAKDNLAVFSSASADQVSSWYPEKAHSLFTYFYLKGITGEADTNKDKKITVGEMQTYLDENVPYMARRLNNREQTPQISGNASDVLIQY